MCFDIVDKNLLAGNPYFGKTYKDTGVVSNHRKKEKKKNANIRK
jgi:hypothetical protein